MDAGDVIAAVDVARKHRLDLAVRSGAHNGAGLASVDDGLVIDLSPMRGVRVDPDARTAFVLGGSLLGDVDHATPLGGGLGHLTRKLGLSIDTLLAADVVLADGSFVTASEAEHEDLFWALRGGGGNFGVVTGFTFRLSPVHTIVGGPTLFSLDRAGEVLRWYREFLPNAEEDLNGFFAFMTVPPGPPFPEELHMKKMCGIVWCYAGPQENADEVFKPVRELRPDLDGIQPMPLPALQSAFDGLYPTGTSGTGGRTSCARSPTRLSMHTWSTRPSCRAGSRPCTSIRSTGRPRA